MTERAEQRILIVDDNASIHEDYKKILVPAASAARAQVQSARAAFLGGSAPAPSEPRTAYALDSAFQGAEALEKVRAAVRERRPYALAFVDMRMPPGWDGVETITRLWEADPELLIVICTAYSDQSWEQMMSALGASDRYLILKKPFDPIEVCQLASALGEKWNLARAARGEREDLAGLVEQRTRELSASNERLALQLEELSRAEREARENAAALEKAYRELEQAHATAQAATRAKSEFLANMSHEIRTPMTAILGYADLLRDPKVEPASALEYLQIIRKNGDHLLTIVDDILDLSKIEAGRMTVEHVACSPCAVITEVASLMRVRAKEKDLAFEIQYETPVPDTIRSDPTRLRQILLNLVGNAIKFTQQGSVRIAVRFERPPAPRESRLVFEVIDTGIGMRPEDQARLFHAFQQADGSTTRQFGGTGLGIAISKRLAAMLGGDISVESEHGRGSRFLLSLETGALEGVQLVERANETIDWKAAGATPPAAETALTLAGRILLAEDGRDNQLLIAFYLRKAGAEVALADNGERAWRAAQKASAEGRPFDLILMDMQMPELDGYEVTRRLRAEGYGGPIVALTAHAMSGDREKCLRAGCNDYLTKPVDRARLIELCARGMSTGDPPPALPGQVSSPDPRKA